MAISNFHLFHSLTSFFKECYHFTKKGENLARWSKLKKRITDLICDDLKDRIGIYATLYRETHDQMGKVWIELDKKVIFEANTLEWEIEYFKISDEIRQINHCTNFRDKDQSEEYFKAYDYEEKILSQQHKMDESQFYKALLMYLNSPFEESLQSKNDLIRVLCLLDKRIGKRRLSTFEICSSDCEAVKILFLERCKNNYCFLSILRCLFCTRGESSKSKILEE